MLLVFSSSTHWMEPSYGHSCPLPAESLPNTRTIIGNLYCSHVQFGAMRGVSVLVPGLLFLNLRQLSQYPICTLSHHHRQLWCGARKFKALVHIFIFEWPLCILMSQKRCQQYWISFNYFFFPLCSSDSSKIMPSRPYILDDFRPGLNMHTVPYS